MGKELDPLRCCVLSSGSGGNCEYIQTNQHQILLDAGLSGIKIERLLKAIHRDIHNIDTLLVSHEHTDHCKGVGVLARRYPNINVYANEKTWQAMNHKVGHIADEQKNIFPKNTTLSFGDVDIESFGVSHDAADAQFYKFNSNNKSFVVITDTGYVSDHVRGIIQGASAYLFECNHDPEMLIDGPYSWPLKQRILSDEGHLSNESSAHAILNSINYHTKYIFLAHRSHNNNMKTLAHLTVASMLTNHDWAVEHDFKLLDTDVEQPSSMITL
ncbi:metallo-hydrolase [Philodulcilactobacillus myokoensis]|uniref:Metallo-hydrolase n=2 Tax=Philodulcilactobacillus myokoensis TaxID=2929573 RepID=A0A9W6ESE6_9LACO|nr:metallo-hydrolase [Philodulcilactobacillus myokoensis]